MKPRGPLEGFKKKCQICGKEFWAMSDWKFTRQRNNKRIYICSWKCLNRYDEKEGRCNVQGNDG